MHSGKQRTFGYVDVERRKLLLAVPLHRGEAVSASRLVGAWTARDLPEGAVPLPVRFADPDATRWLTAGQRIDVLAARSMGEDSLDAVAQEVMFAVGPLLVLPSVDHTWAALALSTMLLVAFVGVLGEAAGATRQYGGVMGKADRMAWLGLAAAASALFGTDLPLQALPILVVAGGALTVLQRLERIHAAV